MKTKHTKPTLILLVLALVLSVLPISSYAMSSITNPDNTSNPSVISFSEPPVLSSETHILLDANSGQILYGKDIDKKMYPASMTKVMTVILALELSEGNLSQTIKVTKEAIAEITSKDAQIALDIGEEISLEDLLYAAMLPSANDACNVIAENFSKDGTPFVEKMNAKAKEIGALNTNFENASGIHKENHYTTAYDMALIFSYAIKNDTFVKIASTENHDIPATNKKGKRTYIKTTNELIKSGEHNYKYAICGKTGNTPQAGYALTSVAEKNGVKLISVIMKASSTAQRFTETANLFNYGFENFERVTIDSSKLPRKTVNIISDNSLLGYASIYSEAGIPILLHKSLTVNDIMVTPNIPESYASAENCTATVTLSLANENNNMYAKLGEFGLKAQVDLLATPQAVSNKKDNETKNTDGGTSGFGLLKTVVIGLLIVLLIALLLMISMYVYSNVIRRKRARERRMERLNARSVNPKDRKLLRNTETADDEDTFDEVLLPPKPIKKPSDRRDITINKERYRDKTIEISSSEYEKERKPRVSRYKDEDSEE